MEKTTARQYLLDKTKADIKIILERRLQMTSQTFSPKQFTDVLIAKHKNPTME